MMVTLTKQKPEFILEGKSIFKGLSLSLLTKYPFLFNSIQSQKIFFASILWVRKVTSVN